jgi:hypothetical protein
MQNLDLDDDEAAALAALLTRTIDRDRYPLSPRDPRETQARACPRAVAAAQGVCAAEGYGSSKTPPVAMPTLSRPQRMS